MKILILIAATFLISCTAQNSVSKMEIAKQEIIVAEHQFAQMAKEKGVTQAFYFFADDSARINRQLGIIVGRDAIKTFYQNRPYTHIKLMWEPDFVDVASSCDLGYTYGKYTFQATDTLGKEVNNSGYFHTVWKKQKDGLWKYVWD